MELKVSKNSAPNKVAGAIAGIMREGNDVTIECVGAAAVNQAIKAAAIATGYLSPAGINLVIQPAFGTITIDGEDRTEIKLICKAGK